MPALKHLLSLQKRHWFLLSLSTTHCLLNLQNMQSYQSKKIVTYHKTLKYATLKQKANYHYFWQIILRVHAYKSTFVMIFMKLHELFLRFPTCIHTLSISCLHSVSLQTLPAGIDVALAYWASEEAFAAITAGGSIVFPCGFISTDRTVTNDPIWTRQAWLCRHAVWSTKKTKKNTHTVFWVICIQGFGSVRPE